MRHGRTFARTGRTLAGLALAAWTLAGSAGCSRQSDVPGPAEDDRVHPAGADRKVHMKFESGPIGELTVTRDTAGRLVVAGVSYFPDGTRLDVALVDSAGHVVSRSQPVVEDALFSSLPLAAPDSLRGGTSYEIFITASFAPGAQTPEVLREVRPGQRYVGEGMTMSRQGHFAYSRRLRVAL